MSVASQGIVCCVIRGELSIFLNVAQVPSGVFVAPMVCQSAGTASMFLFPFASSSGCGKYCVSGHTSYFPQSKEDAKVKLVDGPQNAGLRPWVGNSKWGACRWAI